MAQEANEARVERLSREMGGSPTSTRDPQDVEKHLDQDWGYVFSTGPDRVQRRKQAYQDAGLDPPTTMARPGTLEPNEEGPVHKYVRPGLEALGMAGGALVGAPVAPPLGAAGGAALGFAGGDALASLAERAAGERPPMQSVAQAGLETLDSLAKGGLLEGGGRVLGKVVGKVVAPFAKQYEGEHRTLDEVAKGRGIQLDPHEVLQSRPLALGHKVFENIPFTSGMIQRGEMQKLGALTKEWQGLREKVGTPDRQRLGDIGTKIQDQVDKHLDALGVRQEAVRNQMRDEVLQSVGSPVTYKELGEGTQQAIIERHQALKDVEKAKWDYAREAVPATGRVITKNLSTVAQGFKKDYENFPSFLDEPLMKQLNEVSKSGNPEYDKLVDLLPKGYTPQNFNALPEAARNKLLGVQTEGQQPGWTVDSLIKLRSALSDSMAAHHTGLQRGDAAKGSADAYGRIYTKLIEAVDADLQSFADASGSEVANRFKLARSKSSERLSFFNPKENPWVVKAIQSEAATLDKRLILPGNAAGYTVLKEQVGDQAARPVKQAFTNRLMDVGGKEADGIMALRSNLNRYGRQTLAEVYSEPELKQLYDLADKANWMKQSPIGNPFFRELVKTAPTKVAPTILEHPDLTAKTLRTFPSMKQPLRQAFLEGVHPNERTPFPTRLMDTLNAYPADVQKQLFSQDELRDFHQLAKIVARTKGTVALAENPSGTAQNLVTFTTMGALLKHPIANAPQAMTTAALGKLYLSKLGRKYLLQGLTTPENAEGAARLATNIVGIAGLDMANMPRSAQNERYLNGPTSEGQP